MLSKWEQLSISGFDTKSMLPRWTYERAMQAAAAGERERELIRDIAGLERCRDAIRKGIRRCLGGLPASDTPLRPRLAGTVRGNGFRVENVVFESRPHVYVTANLYVPDGIREPRGAVLLLCGHREKAKHCDEYQTACHYFVHAGLVVLAVDPIGQGERFSRFDPQSGAPALTGVRDHENVGRQCLPLGDSLARYMLHDAMRAIDYLSARPEVDPRRIGVTGHSGGGMQTALVMMADPRIAAAAPGGFIMNRPYFLLTGKSQDAEQKWPGFSALGFDHEDIVLAMAPRPVLVLATTYDSVPIEGPRHTVAVNRRFWELHGQGDKLGLAEDANGHRFTVPLIRAAARFFSAHLLGVSAVPAKARVELIPPARLLCTRSGQIIGELERAKTIYDENAERLAAFEAARSAMPDDERRRRAIDWLREAVYGSSHPGGLLGAGDRFDGREPQGMDRQPDGCKPPDPDGRFDGREPQGMDSRLDGCEPPDPDGRFDGREPPDPDGRLDDRKSQGSDGRFDRREPHGSGCRLDGREPQGMDGRLVESHRADERLADAIRLLPSRRPVALNPRYAGGGETDGLRTIRAVWWSQQGLLNHALLFSETGREDVARPVTIAVWDGGTTRLERHAARIKEICLSGRTAMVLNATGVGPLLPHADSPDADPHGMFGVLDRHTDELMWLGDSMAAVRVYDVLRAVEVARSAPFLNAADIELYGSGLYAVYAGLAALLDPRIGPVRMDRPLSSLADWIRNPDYDPSDSLSFILPGMLRLFDLPDIDRWLAEEGRLASDSAIADAGGERR